MTFDDFDASAVALLRQLPDWDADEYAVARERLKTGRLDPGGALIEAVAESIKKVPAPWPPDHPRGDRLRMNGFQIRCREPLPRSVDRAAFAGWCARRLERLLPVHDWLARELLELECERRGYRLVIQDEHAFQKTRK